MEDRMQLAQPIWADPAAHLAQTAPDAPVMYFAPTVLAATLRRFRSGFPGMVTYAVKANPLGVVLDNLLAAGIEGFDVASPAEIALVRDRSDGAALHYHNPVRSAAEIAAGVGAHVASWSVDDPAELDKLAAGQPRPTEIAVRLRLPIAGGQYNFGEKFGADPEHAAPLLSRVAAMGHRPAITFHPGTQCTSGAAWAAYIAAAADTARIAGLRLSRLNVGGGFPGHRTGAAPDLGPIFDTIGAATRDAFGHDAPALVCEPGRAMVAEAFTLAARVKAVRPDGALILNDGIYGHLPEMPVSGMTDRLRLVDGRGRPRRGAMRPRTVFGPTCDSLDRLPGMIPLPGDVAPGDYLLIDGMGAYSFANATRFNGYGAAGLVTVRGL
jgi:ornithine decarboxylase